MTTRIGLMGDVHAVAAPVKQALDIFRAEGVEEIWCTGDVAGYGDQLEEVIALLQVGNCQVILGNHDLWYLQQPVSEQTSACVEYLAGLSRSYQSVIEGKSLYMVHASPPLSLAGGIRLLDEDGRILPELKALWSERLAGFSSEVLMVGHSHQVFDQQLGSTRVINPGSTLFNHTCAILCLPELQVEWYGLSGKRPVKAWRWGHKDQLWP